jgi:hypothetical protein
MGFVIPEGALCYRGHSCIVHICIIANLCAELLRIPFLAEGSARCNIKQVKYRKGWAQGGLTMHLVMVARGLLKSLG